MSTPRQMNIESRAARHIFLKCKTCAKDREAAGRKLMLCGGCKTVNYCSAACQKKHWSEHKDECLWKRQLLREEARLDEIAFARAKGLSIIAPTQIYAEIRAFKDKFMAAVFQASFNILNLSKAPDAWRAGVVVITLKRVPGLRSSSKFWQRHTVDTIEVMEAQHWGAISGEGLGFVLSKQANVRELFTRGDKVGVIAFAIRAPCMDLDVPWLYTNSNIGYEADTEETLKIEDAWEQTFRDTVERMCGRLAPLGITYPNDKQPDLSVPDEDDTQNIAVAS